MRWLEKDIGSKYKANAGTVHGGVKAKGSLKKILAQSTRLMLAQFMEV
jgi:hypothetical protein